jgi:hypothetical protein
LAVVFFAVSICRVGAISDDSFAAALKERIAAGQLLGQGDVPGGGAAGQLPLEQQRSIRRATG